MSDKLVTPGQRVALTIRGLGSTSGSVDALMDDSVMITLVVEPGREATVLGDPDAVLEYAATRGMYRQEGFARFDAIGSGSVCFVSRDEPKLVQRRDFVRVDVKIPVEIAVQDSSKFIADTLNISANGLLIETSLFGTDRLRLGTFLWMTIPLDDPEQETEGPIEARGTAVRDTGNGGVGIRFDHINEKHQERLVRFVFRKEVERRKREQQVNG
jgi:PilZ domain